MSSTDLPWRLRGRALRPYAFAVSLATAVTMWSVFTRSAVGQLLDGLPGQLVGVAALFSVLSLWVGFWFRSDNIMRLGLLWTTGVWTTISTILFIDVGATPSTLLAGCWAVASGGAWLLEATNPRSPDE